MYIYGQLIGFLPLVGLLIAQLWIPLITFWKCMTIYYSGLITMTLVSYTTATFKLVLMIYKRHRLAFQSHTKSLVSLFVATEISLLLLLLFQISLVR